MATPACEDDALALFPEVFRTRGRLHLALDSKTSTISSSNHRAQ
ncbi:hypothetical protein [Streptomyces sp900129855]|uniref:Uncharacterized protein n=1 Tax=Streptomyces sp. 900129855 TaxID=3155129 RepID=A0ABV2ZZF2_9ACTN